MKQIFILITSILLAFNTFGQDHHKIDSLQNELNKFELKKKGLGNKSTPLMDSTKANILNNIGREYWNSRADSSLYYGNEVLFLSEKIGYKKGIGDAYSSLGIINYNYGDYSLCLEYIQKAFKVYGEIGDKKDMAITFCKLGSVDYDKGNYPEGLKNLLTALKLYQETGDVAGIAFSYNRIGLFYDVQGNFQDALKSYFSALNIEQQMENKNEIAASYNYIGLTYFHQRNYTEGINNELQALKYAKEANDRNRSAWVYNILGNIYEKQNNYPEALSNYENSLKIVKELNQTDDIAYATIHIGIVNEKQGNLKDALRNELKGLSIVISSHAKNFMKEAYEELAMIYAKLHDYKDAYENEVLFHETYDTIFSNENEQKLNGLQMQYRFEKVNDSTKAEQSKKDAIAAKEIENQKQIRNYILGGLLLVVCFLILVFRQRNKIAKQRNKIEEEKKRSDDLLLNILPEEVAEELKEKGSADAKMFDEVTVMFTDFKGFTNIAEKLSAKELVAEINYCFSAFDNIIHKYNIEKIKTIGDAYMAAGGLPVVNKTHAKDVVKAAIEINKFMEEHKQQRIKDGKEIFEIRIGIHTGPVVAGIVGIKKFAYDIWGDTVNLASRMESSGEAGKVNISGTTYELIKNDFNCVYRGKIQAKNKGEVDMYFVS